MTNMLASKTRLISRKDKSNLGSVTGQPNLLSKVFLFKGEEYLGWDCFQKNSIAVGRGEQADVVLSDKSIEDIQAVFQFSGDQIKLVNVSSTNRVCVNGEPVKSCTLSALDFVAIGPYTLKVKTQKVSPKKVADNPPDRPGNRKSMPASIPRFCSGFRSGFPVIPKLGKRSISSNVGDRKPFPTLLRTGPFCPPPGDRARPISRGGEVQRGALRPRRVKRRTLQPRSRQRPPPERPQNFSACSGGRLVRFRHGVSS